MINKELLPNDYPQWLAALKVRIATAQQQAGLAVNQELILLYWQIGRHPATPSPERLGQ